MFTPAPGNPYYKPSIFVHGTKLPVVDKFIYLGSTLSRFATLDEEVVRRIERGSVAFGRLQARVWSQRDINIRTKLGVYDACVITPLLFASETWTTHQRH